MTCIGQSNLCVSSGYVHETCTHQMIHGAHLCSLQVIQCSLFRQPQLFCIPELLFDSRGYFVFQSFYSTAVTISYSRAFIRQSWLFCIPKLLFFCIQHNRSVVCLNFLTDSFCNIQCSVFSLQYHVKLICMSSPVSRCLLFSHQIEGCGQCICKHAIF